MAYLKRTKPKKQQTTEKPPNKLAPKEKIEVEPGIARRNTGQKFQQEWNEEKQEVFLKCIPNVIFMMNSMNKCSFWHLQHIVQKWRWVWKMSHCSCRGHTLTPADNTMLGMLSCSKSPSICGDLQNCHQGEHLGLSYTGWEEEVTAAWRQKRRREMEDHAAAHFPQLTRQDPTKQLTIPPALCQKQHCYIWVW